MENRYPLLAGSDIVYNEKENADNKGKPDEENTWDKVLETAAIVGGFIWAAAKIVFEITSGLKKGYMDDFLHFENEEELKQILQLHFG